MDQSMIRIVDNFHVLVRSRHNATTGESRNVLVEEIQSLRGVQLVITGRDRGNEL